MPHCKSMLQHVSHQYTCSIPPPPANSCTSIPPARSKNTIDTVYAKLQKAEAEGEAGVHGASTGEVMESVLQVGWWGLLAGCDGGPSHQVFFLSGGTLRRWVVDSKV